MEGKPGALPAGVERARGVRGWGCAAWIGETGCIGRGRGFDCRAVRASISGRVLGGKYLEKFRGSGRFERAQIFFFACRRETKSIGVLSPEGNSATGWQFRCDLR